MIPALSVVIRHNAERPAGVRRDKQPAIAELDTPCVPRATEHALVRREGGGGDVARRGEAAALVGARGDPVLLVVPCEDNMNCLCDAVVHGAGVADRVEVSILAART